MELGHADSDTSSSSGTDSEYEEPSFLKTKTGDGPPKQGRGSSPYQRARDPPSRNIDDVRQEFLQRFIANWPSYGQIDWGKDPKDEADRVLRDNLKREVKECMAVELLSDGGSHAAKVGPLDDSPTYLHVICGEGAFSLEHKRLLFQIAFELRTSSIFEKSSKGETPLHIAANKDKGYHPSTKLRVGISRASEEDPGLHLMPFICRRLLQHLSAEQAAEAVAIDNLEGETCLHIAVRRNIWGVTDLLDLANEEALLQKRRADVKTVNLAINDSFTKMEYKPTIVGNTPLHDALHFQFYEEAVPTCATPQKAESMDYTQLLARASNQSSHVAAPVNPERTQPQCVKANMCSGASALQIGDADIRIPPLDARKNRSVQEICKTCKRTNREYAEAKAWRRELIGKMIGKCPEALTIHNSQGLSPYLYHIRTRETAGYQGHEDNNDRPQNSSADPGRGQQASIRRLSEAATPPLGGGLLARILTPTSPTQLSATSHIEETSGNPKASKMAEGELETEDNTQEAGKAAPTVNGHSSRSRVPRCQKSDASRRLSDEVLEYLKEKALTLPERYRDAHKCLFRGAKSGSKCLRNGKQPPQHSWQPSRRISPKTQQNYDFMSFEPMMALLHIRLTLDPWMTAPRTDEEIELAAKADESALVEFFKWLKREKKVRAILKLVMRDNPARPCSEATVRECLHGLEVRYLDWNKRDLSIDTLKCAENIVELWLYSSGVHAVLCGWADQHGLQTLDKLRRITLISDQGFEPEKAHKDNLARFKKRLEKLYEHRGGEKPYIEIDPPTRKAGTHKAIGDGGGEGMTEKEYHPWFQAMKAFTAGLKDKIETSEKLYTKVALIDDGVDPDFEDLGSNLSQFGWPVEPEILHDDKDGEPEILRGAWTSPGRDQHGNKMAHLIATVCPFLKLYVAKVDADLYSPLPHPSFNVAVAAEAIEWATEQGVDIISMSWNVQQSETHDDIVKLRTAIQAANAKGILMYGAASDNKAASKSSEPYYPGEWSEVTSIGAANWDQLRMPYVGPDADFLFPGEYILNADDGKTPAQEGGNSAATALASGLAAFVLFCLRQENHTFERIRHSMDRLFHRLTVTDKPQFVDIKNLIPPPTTPGGTFIQPSCQEVATQCKPFFLPPRKDLSEIDSAKRKE